MAKRTRKETPLGDGQQREPITIDLPDGTQATVKFTEPATLTEETIELDAAESVLLDQMIKDRLQQEAQQPQEVQQAQASTGGAPMTGVQQSKAIEAAHEAADAIDSFLQEPEIAETVAQQEELQKMMQLSWSEIEVLPQEKQQILYEEVARQLVEAPGFVDGMNAIAEMGKRAAATASKIKGDFQQITESAAKTIREVSAVMDSISNAINNLLSVDTREALRIWATLAPYIEAEADEYPEKYSEQAAEPASADELIAAAARRARADGKEIPPLKAEEPAPLQLQLDLPTDTIKKGNAEPGTPAAFIETIKKMPVLNPQAHIMPNNALINVMQHSGIINAGEISLLVANEKGRRKEITAYTMIEYDPGETDITITDPKMTEYERNVSNAIVSLWVEAERLGVEPVFTADTVYRAMPGGGEIASPQQRRSIARAIEKGRRTHMTIDATEELRKRGTIGDNETFRFDEYYYQMTRAKRTSKHGGQSVTAYRLTEKPVILKYAEMTRQILTAQAKYLTIRKIDKNGIITTELVTMNADRQSITGYMLRRIAVMKHDLEDARDRLKHYEQRRKKHPELELPEKPLAAFRQQRDTILFDTLFSETDTKTDNREQTRRNREFCLDVLAYWKATGFINGYSTQSKGKKITGIVIEL